MGFTDRVATLLGISSYTANRVTKSYGPDPVTVDTTREALGGNIAPLPTTRLNWYLSDLDRAQFAADTGDMSIAAQLMRSTRRDGMVAGLMGALCSGVVRLPKRFYGHPGATAALRSKNGTRSIFDSMCPASELALLAADGYELGVGIGELLPVPGRSYPVLQRLEPEHLRYRWTENTWYYNSVAGPIPITPGDGHWVLHMPGGRATPWMSGTWPSIGRSFINKEHAMLNRSNYSGKLANPARIATAPIGATDEERAGFLQRLIQWGINTCFAMPIGWDVKLIESNGRGIDVFQAEIDTCNQEIMVSIAGQVITTEGGAGFSATNDIYSTIRLDIIKSVANGLAQTIEEQILPQYVLDNFGEEALDELPTLDFDVTEPKDMKVQADTLVSLGSGLTALQTALTPFSQNIDVVELMTRYGIPLQGDTDGDGIPDQIGSEAVSSLPKTQNDDIPDAEFEDYPEEDIDLSGLDSDDPRQELAA